MTISQPNHEVEPTGEEPGEFIDDGFNEPGEQPDEEDAPSDEKMYTSEPLEDEDGNTYVIQQQNVGRANVEGGGEWPDPATPPRAPAPGAA